jgi:glucokinase-like ROK family protein
MSKPFRTGDQALVRELNRSIILNQLRTHTHSRADLAAITGLNKTTVSSLINELLAHRFVREIGSNPSAGGRPAVLLELNPAAGDIIGVEIGVGYLNVVLTDFCAGILWKRQALFTESDSQPQVMQYAITLVQQAIHQCEQTGARLLGIGIAVPGLVDTATGTLVYSPNLEWRNVPLRQIFAAKFGLPIFVDNDANAAALAEHYMGATQQIDNYVSVVANAGIGAGIVLGGQVFHGITGYAGEVGHVTLEPDGPPCHCGNRGCWERLAGQSALIERVHKAIQAGAASSIKGSNENAHSLCLHAILEAARQGDAVAQSALAETGRYLGIGIANLVNTFNPDRVVLCGALSLAEEFLTPVIQQTVLQRAMSGPREATQFVVSRFKSDACVMGGVALVMHDILSSPRLDGLQSPRHSDVFATRAPRMDERFPQILIDQDRPSLANQSSRQPGIGVH